MKDVNKEVKKFRESIFIIDNNEGYIPIELEQWGAGEYKITDNTQLPNNKCIVLYIPYLNFITLEKAYIAKRFLEKRGIEVLKTVIGYCSYSRQERETDNEPELLSGLLDSCNELLGDYYVIDGHNKESFNKLGVEVYTSFNVLLNSIKEDYIIVAPDKGAKSRNNQSGIKTGICMNKRRIDGKVLTEIGDIDCDIKEDSTFVILDDICDGGRTFANACEILKGKYPNSKVILAVAHAILPYGIELLKEKGIDKIITANTCYPVGLYCDGYIEVNDIFF